MLSFTHALTAAEVSYFLKEFSFRQQLPPFCFWCFWCFSIIAAYLFLIFFSIHTSVCSALITDDYIVPCCFLIIPWWQQALPFFVFGYFLNKCIMSSAMGRRYSFITYLFLQMCTWHACLFPASGIRPSYTRHLISGSRHCFFMIFIRSWCHMGLLLYSSHSSPHGHMRTLYNAKYFQSFLSLTVCYLSPASVCGIFLSCCQKHDIFHKKTNFRQQAWSLSILFLFLSFMTDVFPFTVISPWFYLLFIYIVRNWYIRLFSLLTSTYWLLLCTDCCRKPVFFWILSLIPAAALALLYLHALFFYHLCLMCLFIPYTIFNHLYMMFFLCTCGFPYGSYYQKCYFHHL